MFGVTSEKGIQFFPFVLLFLADSIPNLQNTTIDERVALLEIQVDDIQGDVSVLIENDNFLFDEQVIQDERNFSLEQRSIEIDEEVEGNYHLLTRYSEIYQLLI